MDDYPESRFTFNFKKSKTEFTHSFSFLPQIKFKFLFEYNLSQWLRNQDTGALRISTKSKPRPIEYLIHVDIWKLLSYEKTYEEIHHELKFLPISDNERDQLIEFAWKEAFDTIMSKSVDGYATLNLDFQLVLEKTSIYRCESRLVDSLVQTLNKRDDIDIDYGNSEIQCSICLEDLSKEGGEATGLPCSHVFHGGCIAMWLRAANHCPLCRLELTAATSY